MAIYCIWSGGDGTQTNTTQTAGTLDWSKADTSVADLIAYDAAAFTTSGNTIYFADDHNDPNKAAHWTLTGPTSGLPVILISADRSLSTPTVKAGTGNQLSSLGGAYSVTLDGSFALYKLRAASGARISLTADGDEVGVAYACLFAPGNAEYVALSLGSFLRECTIDCAADTSNNSSAILSQALSGKAQIIDLTLINVTTRTGWVFSIQPTVGIVELSGLDASGLTNATLCELFSIGSSGGTTLTANNIKTAATWQPFTSGNGSQLESATLVNCGPADAPTYLANRLSFGDLLSSTDIYRTGGATVEGTACSWLITTTSACSEHSPFYTPWRYGTLSSTGSKTFEMYITNDTADLTDAEIWLEVEYKSESTEAIWALATDQRATITTTAAAQTDDTASTWNGSGPSYTYKQKLSVTATVNQVGQYRVRVAIGKTSVAGSRYLYIDPAVAVS
jgi:hypothetical protein